MGRPPTLFLLLMLLTLCITAGTPEVWVQVQMEAAEFLSFTVHCGFQGFGSISLVTVSCGGPEDAGRTKLAVLSPESGAWLWDPDCEARWETKRSISVTLKSSEDRRLGPNTTFCCKFVSFPGGSQEACDSCPLSTDPGGAAVRDMEGPWDNSHLLTSLSLCIGFPAPSPVPMLQAGLVGILGVSGVLLLGCIYLLHLLYQQRHWSTLELQTPYSHPQAPQHARAASEASRTSLPPHSASASSDSFPTAPHIGPLVLPPATSRAALYGTARGRFVSVENGLYTRMEEGPLIPFLDPLGPRAGVGRHS